MAAKKRTAMDALIARRNEFEDVSPSWTAPEQDLATASAEPAPLPAEELSAEGIVKTLPVPHEPLSRAPELVPQERDELERYERALTFAGEMFWVVGHSLRGIRQGELYRETHPTFEAYLVTRDLSARRAYQLMEVAPLAEFLYQRMRKIFHSATLNEAQTRALLPLANRHGQEAAAVVLETATRSGQKVTATLLKGAVAVLPADRFDREEAEVLLQQYLNVGQRVLPAPDPDEGELADPAAVWTAEAERLRSTVRRAVTRPAFRAAARARPDEARAVVAELRALLDEVEAAATEDEDD